VHSVMLAFPESRDPVTKAVTRLIRWVAEATEGLRRRVGGILDAIGRTPMIDLSRLVGKRRVRLLAKAEFLNPGGSVKDRPAKYIVLDALRRGELGTGRRLLDATSGNMGIGYSLVCAALGIPLTLVVPGNVSPIKMDLMRYLGAELIVTDPLEGIDGAILKARELYQQNPKAYFYADQYSNPANPQAHYETTGKEILVQTRRKVTHFVAGVGTSGTLMGVGKRLRESLPGVKIVEVQPAEPLHGIEGLKRMDEAIRPAIYSEDLADERVYVSTEEAYRVARDLARLMGVPAGPSSAANVAAAMRVTSEIEEGVVVTVLPDSAQRYLHLLRNWGLI